MKKPKITVETTVKASPDKVWNCWTSPGHITKWNQASDDWRCPKATNDVRTGGKFSFTMAAKDGSASFDFEGVYNEVIDKKKIAYTMADGRQATVLFEGQNGSTKITESFDPEDVNSEEMQRGGWQAILDSFRKYTESN